MNFSIILDVYFGEKLLENQESYQLFSQLFTSNTLFYFVLVFAFFYFLFIIYIFIIPLYKKSPSKYFERYVLIRDNLKRIDELFDKKEIDYEDYIFAQFNYAKEYEQIIKYLSNFKDYKAKLKSYKITNSSDNVVSENKPKSKFDQTTDFLYDLLLSQTKYYSKNELKQAILDENYSQDVAENVIYKMIQNGVLFCVQNKDKTTKVANFINSLVGESKISSNFKNSKFLDQDHLNIKSAVVQKNEDSDKFLSNESEIYNFKNPKKEEVSKSFFTKMFPRKKRDIKDINDIFKDIEKSLKK